MLKIRWKTVFLKSLLLFLAVRGGPPFHDSMPRLQNFKVEYLRILTSEDDSERISDSPDRLVDVLQVGCRS